MGSITQTYGQFNESVEDRISTTNATLTDCITIPVAISRSVFVVAEFAAAKTDFTESICGFLSASFRRESSGDIIQVGTTQSTFNKSTGLITCDVQANLDNTSYLIKLQVKGKAATNIDWSMRVKTIVHI